MPNKELKEIESAIEALKVRDRMTGGLLVSNQVALSCMELVKEIMETDDDYLLGMENSKGKRIKISKIKLPNNISIKGLKHRYQQIRKSK